VRRVLAGSVPKGSAQAAPQINENRQPETAA